MRQKGFRSMSLRYCAERMASPCIVPRYCNFMHHLPSRRVASVEILVVCRTPFYSVGASNVSPRKVNADYVILL